MFHFTVIIIILGSNLIVIIIDLVIPTVDIN